MYHPYVNTAGVVSPFVNPAARAQFFGLSIEHTRAHLFRAVYEGVALSMLDAYEHMPEECEEILLSGGGAQSKFWSQMFADATGRRVRVAGGSEFGARGAAMVAGVGAGIYNNIDDAARTAKASRTHEPSPAAAARYRELYKLYVELYRTLGPLWRLRAGILDRASSDAEAEVAYNNQRQSLD
jgi:sugar (pentulose or hexulose) kinase